MSSVRKAAQKSFWSFPSLRFPFSLFEENEDEWLQDFTSPSGLSVSEDEGHVYVEAALPGVKPEEIEMTYHKGMLFIRAEKKEEAKDRNKKFYRKAMNLFSYHISVPGNVDENKQPEAVCKNGVLIVTFDKTAKDGPKKIAVKHG
jgi:Molecular chaperone (small heat shock protein)